MEREALGERRPRRLPATTESARSTIRRMIIAVVVTLVVVLAVAATGLVLVRQQVALTITTVSPAAAANRSIRQSLGDAQTALQTYRDTRDPRVLQPYTDARLTLPADLDALDAVVADDPVLGPLAADQREAAVAWLERYAAAEAGPDTVTAAQATAANRAFDAFTTANRSVSDALRTVDAAITDRISILVWTFLGASAVLVAVGLWVTVRLGRLVLARIGPPLEQVEGTVGRLRRGELTARADPSSGVVEIQAVAAAVNEMAAAHQRRVERDAEDLRLAAAVRDLSVGIGSSLDLDAIAEASARGLVERFGAASAWVRIFDEGGVGTSRTHRYPDVDRRPPPLPVVDLGRRMAEESWRRQTYCLLSRDDPSRPGYLTEQERQQIFAVPSQAESTQVLFVPIGVGPQCLGYVGMNRTAGQPVWSVAEITAVQGIGRDLGRAALHARLFERESYLVDELREIDGRKSDFVSMVSHELRTPLASIVGHLEIVRSGDLGTFDPDLEPSLQAIDRNALRLTTLIEDLLLLSRIEQRAQPAALRPVDLARVAPEVVGLLADPAARQQLRVQLDADDEVRVLGDEQELERVLSNLVSNAIKYSGRPGTVRIEVTGAGHEVVLSVSDEGIGIAERDRTLLFDRFYRSADPRAAGVPGTGLGLAITKLIIEKHGGSIEVTSELDRGSTFTVRLPRLVEPALSAAASTTRSA